MSGANGAGKSKRKRGKDGGLFDSISSPDDFIWADALKVVRKEEEVKKRNNTPRTFAETMGLPLVLLGLHPPDQDLRNSHEKQLFKEKIASFYKEEMMLNNNSIHPKNRVGYSGSSSESKVCLEDPNFPDVCGARRRKTNATKLKFTELASSKPFDDTSLYNITARKTDSLGLESFRVQWFQSNQPPVTSVSPVVPTTPVTPSRGRKRKAK